MNQPCKSDHDRRRQAQEPDGGGECRPDSPDPVDDEPADGRAEKYPGQPVGQGDAEGKFVAGYDHENFTEKDRLLDQGERTQGKIDQREKKKLSLFRQESHFTFSARAEYSKVRLCLPVGRIVAAGGNT